MDPSFLLISNNFYPKINGVLQLQLFSSKTKAVLFVEFHKITLFKLSILILFQEYYYVLYVVAKVDPDMSYKNQ
jgi:hypothetical protein